MAGVIGSVGDARFERLTAAVIAEDPVGLIASGSPSYEYEPEVENIQALGTAATSESVRAVFDAWLDDNHALTEAGAERIAAEARLP